MCSFIDNICLLLTTGQSLPPLKAFPSNRCPPWRLLLLLGRAIAALCTFRNVKVKQLPSDAYAVCGTKFLAKMILSRNLIKHVRAGVDDGVLKRFLCEATPPRNRIPLATKAVHGLLLSVIPYIYPAWVIYHVPDYQSAKK